MSSRLSPEAPGHVIVAGGGFAAVEALLALRALAGSRVSLELIAADGVLHDRPGATAVPFGAPARAYDLAVLAERVGATFRQDAVVSVAAREHTVRLASGPTRPYDGLVLALGARSRAGVPGATVFRDQRDAARIAVAVEELCDGRARRIVFAAPVGISWTLPLYELALQTARAVETAGGFAEVTVATPEERPLEAFGEEAAGAVRHLLARHGVHLVTRAHPRGVDRAGLVLRFGGTLRADHVVAVPQLAGPTLGGVPADWNGFVTTDRHGRVDGLPDVFAAGDMTDFPIKQGGLAAQAADEVARAVAAELGAKPAAAPERRVLRATLLGADEPLYLRAELDEAGRPVPAGSTVAREAPGWPPGKVLGRYLSPALAAAAA